MQKKDAKNRKTGKSCIPYIFPVLGIVIIIAMAAAVYRGIRPWQIVSVDASTAEGTVLDPEHMPEHIRVRHMDLSFTGMYTVDAEQKRVLGYYYIGSIGDQTWIVEMPAHISKGGLSEAIPDLKDQSFEGIPVTNTDIVERLSAAEGMDAETYTEKYNISPVPICAGTHIREKQMIEYGIAVIMIICCFLIGHMMAHGKGDDREDVENETI